MYRDSTVKPVRSFAVLVDGDDLRALRDAERAALQRATDALVASAERLDIIYHDDAMWEPITATPTERGQQRMSDQQAQLYQAALTRQRCVWRIIELSHSLDDFEADFPALMASAKPHWERPEFWNNPARPYVA